MIWTTWRQHRAQAAVGATVLTAICVALIVVGVTARDRTRALGLTDCGDGARCSDALSRLRDAFHSLPPFIAALLAVPLLAGMFWGAPLLSREYEAGTHRLAWTQSISPLRWISAKIALIFGACAAGAVVLGLLATWTLDPLVPAFGGRYNSTFYDVQGVLPLACLLFALGVGVAASAVLRRTIPAMALTLVAFALARIPMHWVRWRFAPLEVIGFDVPLSTLLDEATGAPADLAGAALPLNSALQSLTITGPSGNVLSNNTDNFSVLQDYCPDLQVDAARASFSNAASCAARVEGLSVHERIAYQPADHFWLIQSIEAVLFLGAAGLFVVIAIVAVHRRRPS